MSKIFDDEDYAWGLLEKLLETRNESTKFRSTNQYTYMKSKIRAGNTRKTNSPSKPKKTNYGGTLCWGCQNSVPSADGVRGCEWSCERKPVPGWVAEEVIIKNREKRGKVSLTESYHVISCPRFEPD